MVNHIGGYDFNLISIFMIFLIMLIIQKSKDSMIIIDPPVKEK